MSALMQGLNLRQRRLLEAVLGDDDRVVIVRRKDGQIELRSQAKINFRAVQVAPEAAWEDLPV